MLFALHKCHSIFGFAVDSSKFEISLGIPNLYQGNLHQPDEVLEWIIGEISGDHTVEVTYYLQLKNIICIFSWTRFLSSKVVLVFFDDF